jgi:hypothetical protein
MSQRTFESQFAELGSLLFDAAHTGDIVASLNYTSRICALKKEQLDTANARIAELEAALDALRGRYRIYAGWPEMNFAGLADLAVLKMADDALNPTTEEAPCSQL